MNREYKNIRLDNIKRKLFLKNEIQKLILKSIFQNRYTKNTKRFYSKIKLLKFKKKINIAYQKKRCVLTGQSNGIYKNFELNRHMIKKLNTFGMVQNLTLKKW
jgi:ribosomal protein S14